MLLFSVISYASFQAHYSCSLFPFCYFSPPLLKNQGQRQGCGHMASLSHLAEPTQCEGFLGWAGGGRRERQSFRKTLPGIWALLMVWGWEPPPLFPFFQPKITILSTSAGTRLAPGVRRNARAPPSPADHQGWPRNRYVRAH